MQDSKHNLEKKVFNSLDKRVKMIQRRYGNCNQRKVVDVEMKSLFDVDHSITRN